MLQGEHSAILSTFIKLPFAIKIFVFLSGRLRQVLLYLKIRGVQGYYFLNGRMLDRFNPRKPPNMIEKLFNLNHMLLGRVAQSVTCLATDACLAADPGVTSSIPVRSHTFVEII